MNHQIFTKQSPQTAYRQRCYKNFDKLQFRADLIKVNWDSICHDPDPNSAGEHFLKIAEKLLDKHAPYKNIKQPKSQFETKPWITLELAYSIKIKIKFYKRFCKEKDPHKKQNYERQFKTYHSLIYTLPGETKNLITNNTLVTTKKTPETTMADHKGDNKHDKKSDESIPSLLIDNQLITSVKQISNHFNNFFTSIAGKINRNIV